MTSYLVIVNLSQTEARGLLFNVSCQANQPLTALSVSLGQVLFLLSTSGK